MKKIVATLIISLCAITAVNAQTFLENLQKKQKGQGTVTVTQSKDIDDLVNGKNKQHQTNTVKPKVQDKQNAAAKKESSRVVTDANKEKATVQHDKDKRDSTQEKQHQEKETYRHEPVRKPDTAESNEDFNIPEINTRKKVMRGSHKVTGYRVQVFAGGNSRKDRQKAEQIRNNIKMRFPTEPIYVHFYSPRWICRMGNYRSYQEAEQILRQVKSMGYKSACIVRGKITVQY